MSRRSRRTFDPNPPILVEGHCAACTRCTLDLRSGCCTCGGPFNDQLVRDGRAFVENTEPRSKP